MTTASKRSIFPIMSTEQKIRATLEDTYGKTPMVESLGDHIIEQLPTYVPVLDDRESKIQQICWNWFSGGTTAASVAMRIETILKESEQ